MWTILHAFGCRGLEQYVLKLAEPYDMMFVEGCRDPEFVAAANALVLMGPPEHWPVDADPTGDPVQVYSPAVAEALLDFITTWSAQ